jgi:hypothetical protein
MDGLTGKFLLSKTHEYVSLIVFAVLTLLAAQTKAATTAFVDLGRLQSISTST